MVATLIMVVAVSRAAVAYHPAPPAPADAGAKRAMLQYLQGQNERSPGLMAPVLADKFQTLSAQGMVVGTDSRAKMLAGLKQGSPNQTMHLSLDRVALCGPKRTQQTWTAKDSMSETGVERYQVKMIPGEARALVTIQVKARISPTQEVNESAQFVFYLKRQAGTWVVYGVQQPG